MSTSLRPLVPGAHPQPISVVECERLEDDIRRVLLQAPTAGDEKVKNRKKDIQKGFNKVAETLSQLLVHSFNNKKPIGDRLTNAIGDFFSARTQRTDRRLRDLMPIETKEEGDVNVAQMAIAQGDMSTSTLIRLVTELDEYIPVLQEMRAAAVLELQKPARSG